MKKIPKKIWIPLVILVILGSLFHYNRPSVLQKAVLMSTPLIFRDKLTIPYTKRPKDVHPPVFDIFYATDRQPTDISIISPLYYGNSRSLSLTLGKAFVRFGDEDASWPEIEKQSFKKERALKIPMKIAGIEVLNKIGDASQIIDHSTGEQKKQSDRFINDVNKRLAASDRKSINIFVPGFKVDFSYPVLVAAELWYYMGCQGAFIAYSWPSGQRVRDYLSDVETTTFTAQHFRMLLKYLAEKTNAEHINILSYSAGARIVSQAVHELRLMTYGASKFGLEKEFKINQVIFAAPDIDMMLFQARYRDGFEDVVKNITIYTNANDTALNWALRFFGWPRLGAPGEMGLAAEDLHAFKIFNRTQIVDVSAAEEAASGNGHGYFVKSPWVSTDLILILKNNAPPFERGLYKRENQRVWKFTQKYPQRLRQAVQASQ